MKTYRGLVALALSVVVAGCSGGGNGSSNSKPEAIILEPHDTSSHFPGDVDFDGRASDEEDGLLASAALAWQILDVDGDVVGGFQGATGTISLLVAGEYTAVLTAEDSKGKKDRAEHPFKIANTIGAILEPDNEDVLGIADAFDLTGRAETVAPGVFLATMAFVGIELDSEDEVFRLPIAVPASLQVYETTVSPSLAAGRYRLRLEVTTTSLTELAEDNIRVLADAPPVVSITSPVNDTRAMPGASIQFSSIVSDPGGGTPALTWTSSVEGSLSTELAFTNSSLPRAKHLITLTAVDENGLSASASVELYIEDPAAPLFANVTGLPDPEVLSIGVKPGTPDAVWIGTVDGISRVAADTGIIGASHTTAYNTNGVGPANAAACIASGECLFGIGGNAVSIRDAGDAAWSTFQTGLTSVEVRDVAQAPISNNLFFATSVGITQTDALRANPVAHNQNALDTGIRSVAVGADGTVWAGTEDTGLVRLTLPSSMQTLNEDNGLANDAVNSVAVDDDGDVWIGTNDGLSRYDPILGVFTSWDNELPDPNVLSVAVDGDLVWLGTASGGARYDRVADLWTSFDATDLASRRVNAVAVDTDGSVWFGCGPAQAAVGGLTRYNGP